MPIQTEKTLYQRLRRQLAGKLQLTRIETDVSLGVGDVWYTSAPVTRACHGWLELKVATFSEATHKIRLIHPLTAPQAEFLSMAYLGNCPATVLIGVARDDWWRYILIRDIVRMRNMVGIRSFSLGELLVSTGGMPGVAIVPEAAALMAALR